MKKYSLLFALLLPLFARAQSTDFSAAKVQKIEGIYVFCDAEPVSEYEYLGTVKDAKVVWSGSDLTYIATRDRMIKRMKKDYPQANGMIMRQESNKVDAIILK